MDLKNYPEGLKSTYFENYYMKEVSAPFFANINSIYITGNDQYGQLKINLVPGNDNSLVRLFNAFDAQVKNELEREQLRSQEREKEQSLLDSLNKLAAPEDEVRDETPAYSPQH